MVTLNFDFNRLSKYKSESTSFSIERINTSDFDAVIEFINEDITLPENDPDEYITEIFSIYVDAEVEDFGIGYYEYGSEKCNDVAYGYVVNEIKFEIPWPDNLKWLEERILEEISEKISELEIDSSDNDEY